MTTASADDARPPIRPDVPIDIVIATYGRGDQIEGPVSTIRKSTHSNFTLWVLDQSDDDTTERCVRPHAEQDARVQYRRVPLAGLSATRNHGVALSSSEYVLFTNDDCRVEPDWAEQLLAELADPATWIVFGRVLPGVRDAAAGGSDDTGDVLALKPSTRRAVYHGNRFDLGFGHGHNMGMRRERCQQLGGFDELLGAGGLLGSWDERDLGYRTLRAGGTIVYAPRATIHHCHWQDWAGLERSYANYGLGAGAAVGKYVRCGDISALVLLVEWLFSQGVRQLLSGALKWRRWPRAKIGLGQLWYPWLGMARGRRFPVDRTTVTYRR